MLLENKIFHIKLTRAIRKMKHIEDLTCETRLDSFENDHVIVHKSYPFIRYLI